ncbi:MAG: amidase family protein [Myxococcota bacterium]|nr:amidase family protein [Myxococcota bacterium]
MPMEEYATYDGLGLAELVRKGEVTPEELVEAAIARSEKHDATLNAVVTPLFERARDKAAQTKPAECGAFPGVPFVLKDLMGNLQGVPNTSGSRMLQGSVSAFDAELVKRQERAGLIPIAKTNTPEFGLVPTTEPQFYGPTRNPWNPDHSVGGSSGGSAAVVAAGVVPMGHANDGGGSIRIPASCCGLVGLKPTRGRNPLGPMLGDAMAGLVVEHAVTRTVRDSAALLDATAGPDLGDPYWAPPPERPYLEEVGRPPGQLRIGYWTHGLRGEPLHAECIQATEQTAQACADLGHVVEESPPPLDGEALIGAFLDLWAAGLAASVDLATLSTGRTPTPDLLEPLTWGVLERGRQISASQYQLAVGAVQLAARQVAQAFTAYDAWLVPTLGRPPARIGELDMSESDMAKAFAPLIEYIPFTAAFNATGQPAVSLPLHQSADGLPVGVHFASRFGDEGLLFRLASQLEAACPWKDRRPPIWD